MNGFDTDKWFDTSIRFFLYVLIFWLPYSSAVIEICVITSLVLWLIKRGMSAFKNSKSHKTIESFLGAFRPKKTFLDKPITVFLTICFLSALTGDFVGVSLRGFLTKTLEWFIIFYLVVEVFTEKKHLFIALTVFGVTAVATVLDSLVQYHLTGKDIFSGTPLQGGRATAGFNHGNSLAGYLMVAIPLFLSLLFVKFESKWKTVFLGLASIAAVWALVITFSRSGWIAIVPGILFLLFLLQRKWFYGVIIIIMFTFIGIQSLLPTDLRHKYRLDVESIQHTMEWRAGLWGDSLKLIKEKPLLGQGLNTFMRLFQKYRKKYKDHYQYSPTYAHNCYLQMAAEIGLLGVAAFFWLIVRMLRNMWTAIRSKGEETNLRILFIGLFCGSATFLFHSFFDTNFYSLRLSAYFWSTIGMLVVMHRLLMNSVYDIKTS